MQESCKNQQHANLHEVVPSGSSNHHNDQGDSSHGNNGHGLVQPTQFSFEQGIENQTRGNRNDHDLDDVNHHGHHIHFNELACQNLHPQRGDDGCEQSADSSKCYGKGYIGFCQIGYHIGSNATGNTSHQHDACCHFRLKTQSGGNGISHQRHDDELG